MLSSYTPVATLPTSDLTKARSFYEETLGLTVQRDGTGGVSYTCGSGNLFVYESAYAGTNKATSVTFDVPTAEFDAEVDALRAKSIQFVTSRWTACSGTTGSPRWATRCEQSGSPTRMATSSTFSPVSFRSRPHSELPPPRCTDASQGTSRPVRIDV